MADVAVRAEALGFESVWVAEHLVFPAEIKSRYPYAKEGVPPINPATPLLDPLMVLMQVAARTQRIRLGTNVYILPLRHPIAVARMVTTLDVLSGGRVSFGVGLGWLEEEFTAVGIDFATRAGRGREAIRALRALWTEKVVAFHGKYVAFEAVCFEPKPVQRPHPPILVGGESEAALRRAAALGDGWYGVGHTSRQRRRPGAAAARAARGAGPSGGAVRLHRQPRRASSPPTPCAATRKPASPRRLAPLAPRARGRRGSGQAGRPGTGAGVTIPGLWSAARQRRSSGAARERG